MAVTTTKKQCRELGAGPLSLFFSAIVSAGSGTDTLTITKLKDKAPDADMMRDSFVMLADGSDWRRITEYDENGEVTITSSFGSGKPSNGETVGVYFVLDPDELDDVINHVVPGLFTTHREEIAVVASQNEYTLPTWLQTRQQIAEVIVRDASGTPISEEDFAGVSFIETDNALTLHLNPLVDNTNLTIVVRARKFYTELTADTDTTTCPRPLLIRELEQGFINKAITKHGERVKRIFGVESLIVERELAKIRRKLIAPFETQNYEDVSGWSSQLAPDDFDWGW